MPPENAPIKETLRQRILEAAFKEFYENGFQAGSINRIITQASTTKGALFHHFPSKNQLGYAVVDEILDPMHHDRWSDPMLSTADPVTVLKHSLQEVIDQELTGHGGLLKYGCPLNNITQEMSPLDEEFRNRSDHLYSEWRERIEGALRRGIRAGNVRASVIPRNTAAFIVASHIGIFASAKSSQSEQVLIQASQAFFGYLDSLRP